MPFQEVPAGFLSRPLVGINCIALYGSSMHYGGCTAFQGSYRKMALAIALQGAVHYVPGVLFRETYYSLCQRNKHTLLPQSAMRFKAGSQYDAKQCVALRRLHVYACRNATRCQDRLGSYPYVPLRCILASGRQETPDVFSNKFVRFAN